VHQEFKDRGLALYAINIEESRPTVAGFVRKHTMSLPILLDPEGEVSRAYQITATPTAFLIGRDGSFVGAAVGNRPWMSPGGRAVIEKALGT